jgi:hypothetical protein
MFILRHDERNANYVLCETSVIGVIRQYRHSYAALSVAGTCEPGVTPRARSNFSLDPNYPEVITVWKADQHCSVSTVNQRPRKRVKFVATPLFAAVVSVSAVVMLLFRSLRS